MKVVDNLSIKELIDKWDSGEPVLTVEMGGLGPGYEYCIQALGFETIKRYHERYGDRFNPNWLKSVHRKVTDELDKQYGFSGAQVSVAVSLAAVILRQGYKKALDMAGLERLIQVSKNQPSSPKGRKKEGN